MGQGTKEPKGKEVPCPHMITQELELELFVTDGKYGSGGIKPGVKSKNTAIQKLSPL